ncbi:MAG: mandelate racemase/muconate lactonizing enzyme family protein, partial [Candidatus Puniceispirillum sp.]
MNIQKLETFTSRYVSFVKVTTEDGMSGIGQMSTYHADITAMVFHRQIAPWVLGQSIAAAHHDHDGANPRAVFANLAALVTEREHKFPGSYIYRALAGLDTALWDLVAKAAEVPVTALIGGQAGQLRAYASSMKRDISPADEAARFCQLRDEK